jgi:hypothetical protein
VTGRREIGLLWIDRSAARRWLLRVSVALALLLIVLAASVRLTPSAIEQGRDSGIFAYTAWVIHEGGQPYRDAWDNKPPGVYYINALAFDLLGANRWAIWWAETTFIYAATVLMFWLVGQLVRRWWITWAAALVFVLLARHPEYVWDTNFTESYALLPQVLVFVTGYRFMRQPDCRRAFWIGLAASAAFLIKQTTIGVALAFVPAVLISRHPLIRDPRRWAWLAAVMLGGLCGLGVTALALAANGVLAEAFDATFVSPGALHRWVSRGESTPIWDAVYQTLFSKLSVLPETIGPVAPLVVIGLAAAVWRISARTYPDRAAAADAGLAIWAVGTLIADLLLTNLTHRAYEHYYITLFPALVLLIALSLAALANIRLPWSWAARLIAVGACVYVLVALGYRPVKKTYLKLDYMDWDLSGPVKNDLTVPYVLEHTGPEETVFVWGLMSKINFQAQRFSPTQYHYGYPLVVPDYTTTGQIQEVVDDLATGQPALIVDTTLIDGLRVPPLDPVRRQRWWKMGGRRDVTDLEPIYAFVAQQCVEVKTIWYAVIYHCAY